ncbi:MAG: hypothetical protein MK052_00570 [Alphaproteobacteria bacterium]|nr:hypothetical protein [Alphaproteobacteria bacterium]
MAKKKGKFILSIGDEGGILTYVQGKAVIRRLFAPTPNYSDTKAILELLQSDPKASISMLIDVMDQSYVQQSLPPVSSLSINNLIKRKMERDFAAEDLKGALRIGREKEGRKDWKYLFVTLSKSPQLEAWLDMVIELPNRFEGIYLLPVEAESFMHRIRDGLSGGGKKKKKKNKKEAAPAEVVSKWQLLVAHNKVGGFRQVVLKNGKLIFARLAQPIGDNQPEVIAGNIEQEISVTTEYLKRLGYSDDQGMDVYVITSEAIKASIDSNNINATSAHIFSPHEAAQTIGLTDATEANDQFADVLLAAAFATAKKHALKLETPTQEKLNKLYKGLMAVTAAAALAVIGGVGAIIYFGIMVPEAKKEISNNERQLKTVQQEMDKVKEQEKGLPDNLEKITDLVGMHQLLNDLGFSPEDAINRLKFVSANNEHVLIQSIKWEVRDTILNRASSKNSRNNSKDETAETMNMAVTLNMFGTEVGSEKFNVKIDALNAELREAFEGYTVNLRTQRPGNVDKRTDFDIKEVARDPIMEKPFFTLAYEISGDGVVAEDDAGEAN